MAQQPTEGQADTVTKALADVEAAYRQIVRARAAIDTLNARGQLTCRDVQTYNLQASAVWSYQESVAATLRALGSPNVPTIPAPAYVTWKGITGDRAAEIDCSAPGMAGFPRHLGAARLPAGSVAWQSGPSADDRAVVAAAVARATAAAQGLGRSGGLGFPWTPLVVLAIKAILISVVIVIAAKLIIPIVEAIAGVSAAREDTKSIALQAAQNTAIMEARAKCYDDCAGRGRDPAICAASCKDLYPGWKPKERSGLVDKLVTAVAVGGVAYLGYRFVSRGGLDRLLDRGKGGGSPKRGGLPRSGPKGRLPQDHGLDRDAIDV